MAVPGSSRPRLFRALRECRGLFWFMGLLRG